MDKTLVRNALQGMIRATDDDSTPIIRRLARVQARAALDTLDAEAASGAGEREATQDEYATVEDWEHDDQRELSLLYNHRADDSLQFNRGQMREAIRHGKRLASLPPPTDPAMVAVDRATRDIVLYILDAVANYATAEQNGGEFAEAHRRDLAAMNGDVVAEVRVTLAAALAAAPTIPATGEE